MKIIQTKNHGGICIDDLMDPGLDGDEEIERLRAVFFPPVVEPDPYDDSPEAA